MSFTKKVIEIHITLAAGEFSNHYKTKIIKNLPVLVNIDCAGLPGRNQAKVKIYGIRQDDLESLTFLSFNTLTWNKNKIDIYAGEENSLSLAYTGDIINAFPEYANAPNVYLDIEAISGYYPGLMSVPPYSHKGNIPIANVVKELAGQMKYAFINEGKNIPQASNIFLQGSPIQKLNKISSDYNVPLAIENETVRIYDQNNKKEANIGLRAGNGLIGYPSFTSNGVRLRASYLPSVRIGDNIFVESIVPKSTGVWNVNSLAHSLGTNLKNAPWFTDIETVYLKGA